MVKSPKVYIRDTGLLHALLGIGDRNELFGHPIYGSSFESYIIENICGQLRYWNPFFYRTVNGAELDLVLEKAGRIIAIEVKASSTPQPSRGFWNALEDVGAQQAFIIAPIDQAYPINRKKKVMATPLSSFLETFMRA